MTAPSPDAENSASRARRTGALAALIFLAAGFIVFYDKDTWAWLYLTVGPGPWAKMLHGLAHMAAMTPALLLLGPGSAADTIGRRPTPAAMLLGALVGLAGVLAFWGYAYLVEFVDAPDVQGNLFSSYWLPWWLGATVMTPLMEETLIRGVLWTAVRRLCSARITVLATSVFFMLAHGPDRAATFPCFLVYGLALGQLRSHSGGIAPTILAHSITNAGLTAIGWSASA